MMSAELAQRVVDDKEIGQDQAPKRRLKLNLALVFYGWNRRTDRSGKNVFPSIATSLGQTRDTIL